MSRLTPRPGSPAWARLWARVGWLAAAGLVALVVALTAGTASAERVRTTKSTKVYKRTGEQSEVVTRVAPGKTLEVIAEQGRWLKVRVNGRTGWVTRTSVVELEARDVPRNTRRRPFVDGRSTRRGWSDSAPEDRVGEDAVDSGGDDDGGDSRASRDDDDDDGGSRKSKSKAKSKHRDDDSDDDVEVSSGDDDDDSGDDGDDGDSADQLQTVTVTAKKAKLYSRPSKKARPVLTVRRGAQLTVLDEQDSGEWIRVEDEDGEPGWIASSAVESGANPRRPKRTVSAGARLGFASVGGQFNSNAAAAVGANPPADYAFGSTAVSIDIGGEAVFAYKKDYFLGVGLEYMGCVATPGIRYTNGTMAEDIGFKTHDIDLRGMFGYDFHKKNGMTAWARLGYHYGLFSVANLQNLASIPAETFSGPAIGAALRLPRLTKKIGVDASLDVVYPGKRTQTKGNEDGTQAGAMAAWFGVDGNYAWKGAWNLVGAYRLGYAKTRWTGTSNRVTGATAAERKDLAHVVTVGLGRSF